MSVCSTPVNLVRGFCLCASLVWLSGCGGSDLGTVPVEGTVLVDGKPMEGVQVIFSPEGGGGRAASGSTDASGNFTLTTEVAGDGALAGNYMVSFAKVTVEDDGLPDEVDPDDPASMDAIYGQLNTRKPPKAKDEIAKKYTNPATSGITATVTEEGDNSFTFEIEGP